MLKEVVGRAVLVIPPSAMAPAASTNLRTHPGAEDGRNAWITFDDVLAQTDIQALA